MKKILLVVIIFVLLFSVVPVGALNVSAATSEYYTYTVTGGKATITDCDTSISGEVTIPSTLGGYSVTSIGQSAFYGCTRLTGLTIPDSVTSIGHAAFGVCKGLTNLTIPDSVTNIGQGAFNGCTGLTILTIPDSVTSIGDDAFNGCTGLTSVTIPDSVKSIGASAFNRCTGLTSVNITDLASWCNISFSSYDSNPLFYAGNLYLKGSLVTDIKISDGIKRISNSAFSGCTGLTSVTISDSVISIGSSAFVGCTGLTTVNFNATNCTTMGSSSYPVFEGCTNLKTVNFGDSVSNVPDYAFKGCTGLTSITIGNGVTSIGGSVFSNCASLTSITIPDSVKSIGASAFKNCTSLTSINIPESVTSIGIGAFYGCIGLTTVNFNATNCTTMGSSLYPVFEGCINLKTVNIGSNATSIPDYAFYKCSGLTSVTISESVTSIGNNALKGCTSLEKITLPFVGENADGTGFTNFGYIFGADDKTYPEYDNRKKVPSTLKTVVVTGPTSIAKNAFYECTGITNISLIGNIKVIGDGAFWDCTGLKKVNIPASCYIVMPMAFYNCVNLTDVYYSGTSQQKDKMDIDYGNVMLEEYAEWHYNMCINDKAHTYTNACDTECNVCNSKRTINHTYSNACDKTCNVCGKTRTVGDHKYSNSCDTTCNYCNAKRTIKHTYSNSCDTSCNVCKATRTITHSYKTTTTKATISKNGSIVKKCTVCGKVASKNTIKYIKSFKLSTTTYTYNGKVKTPSVVVKDSAGKTLKKNTDYTVSYANGRKNVGIYKVVVKMKGKYSGTKTLTFKINPAKTTVSKLTAGKKRITVAITKKSTQVTGYQIQYSTSKKFTNAKTKTISSYKTTKHTLKSLSAKKTYYVRVRTYKTVGKTKYYSGWSTYKYVKTK